MKANKNWQLKSFPFRDGDYSVDMKMINAILAKETREVRDAYVGVDVTGYEGECVQLYFSYLAKRTPTEVKEHLKAVKEAKRIKLAKEKAKEAQLKIDQEPEIYAKFSKNYGFA